MNTNAFDGLPKSKLTGKPVLHFVHANGVPSPSYEPLFAIWEQVFSVERIDFFGTDYRYPIDDNWRGLTHQVSDSIQDACDKHGVDMLVAVGHSVGAMTTLQAMYGNVRHVRAAVLLDPSLLMGRRSFGWFVAKQLDKIPAFHHRVIDKMSPAGKSKHRKDSFVSRQAAYDNLRHKGLFKPFDEQCFGAYIKHGFKDNADGTVSLTIAKSVEVAIFRTIPMTYWYHTPKLPKPVCILAGKDSYFDEIGSYRLANKQLGIPIKYHNGTHMFPLEHPQSTAQMVLDTLLEQL
ncbi:MAG: alpha/beta hydrolase [Moraxella sp.]|nr:alpha/beta hydrolase [Moraxella sp.]